MLYCPKCKTTLKQSMDGIFWLCTGCPWTGLAKDTLKELPSRIKMPYVSIDIETTGLDPATCQILEIGAIYDDGGSVDGLPIFHKYVGHDCYVGDAYALAMNAKILKRLSGKWDNCVLEPDQVADAFLEWLAKCGWDGSALTPAGKNYSSFDKQFLDRLPGWKNIKLRHRALDPSILYWRASTDEALPDLQECMNRAGIKGTVAHTAVEDAEVVVRLIRKATKPDAGVLRLS